MFYQVIDQFIIKVLNCEVVLQHILICLTKKLLSVFHDYTIYIGGFFC